VKQLNNIFIAIPFILFVYAQVFALFFLPQSLVLVHILVLTAMTLLLVLFKWNWSFVFIASTTIMYGFLLTWRAFTEQLLQEQQIEFIVMNSVYFVSLLSVWYSVHHLQKLKMTLENEKLKNFELQKYVHKHSSLLTNREFTERVSLSLVGLKRRNEMGYLMKISANMLKNKEKIYNKILAEVIEDCTRDQFDFFTNTDSSTFLIYLENTTEEGSRVVQSRLLTKLSRQINIDELPLIFTTKRVEDLKDTIAYFKVGSFS
jgi:hypothetical protein